MQVTGGALNRSAIARGTRTRLNCWRVELKINQNTGDEAVMSDGQAWDEGLVS